MINFFNEVKDIKPNTEKEKNSKLSRYIEAGLAVGGLGFTAKTVYNTYTRLKTFAPVLETMGYLVSSGDMDSNPIKTILSFSNTVASTSKNKVSGIEAILAIGDADKFSKVVERVYYGANDKTPQGILFSLNNFFSSIYWKINEPKTFIGKIYDKLYRSLRSIIGIDDTVADITLLHSVSLAILGILTIAIIMILYYIIKFIYKRYKARKAKVRMKEDEDFLQHLLKSDPLSKSQAKGKF